MKRKNLLALVIATAIIIVVFGLIARFTGPPPAMRAQVLAADDRDFFPIVHDLITNATESVDVVLYQSRFYFRYPASSSNILISDLAAAGERGLRVRAVLELADWNVENSEQNRDIYSLLGESGVDLYYDPADRTSHSKLVIVDGEYAVVGSSNWSFYSLDRNHEANVVIRSGEVAGAFREFFDGVAEASERSYAPPLEAMPAREAAGSGERYVLIRDLPVSIGYGKDRESGLLNFEGATVIVSGGDFERMEAIHPGFFEEAAGETLRVLARVGRGGTSDLEAVDIERSDTGRLMLERLASDRAMAEGKSISKPRAEWFPADRVVPLVNEGYVPEVTRLIAAAGERIWVSMLNAVYYESTPETARRRRADDSIPSTTNLIVRELRDAARRGVDVRVIVDVGRDGSPSWGEDTFLERLREAGADVFIDQPEQTTHTKLMIVDRDFTVLGSTNWTYHAVEENNETAAIIESADLNAHYADYIDRIISEGEAY